MGLFSRKSSNLRKQVDAGDTPGHPSSNPANALRNAFGMRRAATEQTESANSSQIPLPRAPDPQIDPADYLRSIWSVRERCNLVLDKAKANQLQHFHVDMSKFADTAKFVVSIIKRDFESNYQAIPPHSRWQQFDVDGHPRVHELLASWPHTLNAQERARRLIDLFVVSILLDTGAGSNWQYTSTYTGQDFKHSDGLAIASLEMFQMGFFSSDPQQPCQVDGTALKRMTSELMEGGLQVTNENPINGLHGRTSLLVRLGDALLEQEVFGPEARPGNILDHLLSKSSTMMAGKPVIALPTLWTALMDGLEPIWQESKTRMHGVSLGDAWPCKSLSDARQPLGNIAPFHKLMHWLTYSIMVPMQRLANFHFVGTELLTGLPEYRNGGLLMDTGLLSLKPDDLRRGIEQYHMNATHQGQPRTEVAPIFEEDDDVIIEWRAATVGFLDMLLDEVNSLLGLTGSNKLSMAQMLEAGTWKGGIEIAEVSRPNTREPPILILPVGSVF